MFSFYNIMIKTQIENLYLRPYTINDVDDFARYAKYPEVTKFLRDDFPGAGSKEDVSAYISAAQKNPETHFAIALKDQLIGDIHVQKQNDILRYSGFLGFWLAQEFHGKKYMSASVLAMTGHIFARTNLVRIFARVFANNPASIKVLQKAGYVQEGLFKNAVYKDGAFIDQLQYCKIKS